MQSRLSIPIVGRNFGFKAALAIQDENTVRNIDVRNALRFLDVLIRQGCLASEQEIEHIANTIAAHICQCGKYPPLVSFTQYSSALTSVVKFVHGSSTDVPRAASTVRHLLSVLAKAKRARVPLYEHGESTCLSVFVQRECLQGIRVSTRKEWAGLKGCTYPAVLKWGRGIHPSEYY